MGINPADAPGYTQMYSFGVKFAIGQRVEYMVMTVRALSEEQARRHIVAIFRGSYSEASLQFFTDMDTWKNEAGAETKPLPSLTSDEVQALPERIRMIYSTSSPLHVFNETGKTLAVELMKDGQVDVQVILPYTAYAVAQVEQVTIHVIEKPVDELT